MRTVALFALVACSKKDAPTDLPPAPQAPIVDDAPAFAGCPYEIWPSHLQTLEDGTIEIAPQSTLGSKAPQYGPEHVLASDGTVTSAGTTPRPRRDRTWFLGDDGGSICRDHDDTTARDCVEFELDAELAKLRGYAAAALDPKGRFFVMSFTDESKDPSEDLVVGFDGTGKRLATWKPARGCDERPELVIGRTSLALCTRDEDTGIASSWIVRDVSSGKQLARITGAFDDMRSAVIDDAHFVAYRPDLKAFEAYDVSTPAKPTLVWRTPITLSTPSIIAGAGGVVAIAQASPWNAIILDATTGVVKKQLVIDPCRK